jgi:hypothetical protein
LYCATDGSLAFLIARLSVETCSSTENPSRRARCTYARAASRAAVLSIAFHAMK